MTIAIQGQELAAMVAEINMQMELIIALAAWDYLHGAATVRLQPG